MKTADKTLAEAPRFIACACFNIRRAARVVTQTYDDAFRPLGIRATQFSLLAATLFRGPVTIGELADATDTDRTTLTRNLRLLEKNGWVRTRPGDDRRERVIRITPRGRAIVKRGLPVWKKTQQRVVRALGEDRFHRLLSDLRAVTEAVT